MKDESALLVAFLTLLVLVVALLFSRPHWHRRPEPVVVPAPVPVPYPVPVRPPWRPCP